MNIMTNLIARTLVLLLCTAAAAHALVPPLINYQGRVAVHGVDFDGVGLFKFALVDAAGTSSYWSNDGTSTAGSEPALAVAITVTKGQYSVLLGDTTLPNMSAIPADVLNYSDVLLRVWFNDGTNGSQLLTPDHPLAIPAPVITREVRGNPEAAMDCWQQRGVSGTALSARGRHTAVWTGSEMVVWGGIDNNSSYLNTGGSYNPAGNSWTATTTTGAPTARYGHTAVWTGSAMLVWGGEGGVNVTTGGRYNPVANSWTAMSTTGAPGVRAYHTAVWRGTEMVIWGGYNGGPLNTGGRYNSASNTWAALPAGAPAARSGHTAVWTGSEMIIWGGYNGSYLGDGSRYSPAGASWNAITTTAARDDHTAVWTGSEMIVWGGKDGNGPLGDGARYAPAGNTWTVMTDTTAPAARSGHTAVWTGSGMIIWGGRRDGGTYLNDTFLYIPDCGVLDFTNIVRTGGNLSLSFHGVTGFIYTLWQSDTLTASSWTNTGLTPLAGTGATLSFTVDNTIPARRFFRVQAGP